MQQTFWYIISLYHYIVKLYNPTVCGGHHERTGILYFVSDGFTVVAIVVVKAAQQQKSLRGFFVMQWISMSGH